MSVKQRSEAKAFPDLLFNSPLLKNDVDLKTIVLKAIKTINKPFDQDTFKLEQNNAPLTGHAKQLQPTNPEMDYKKPPGTITPAVKNALLRIYGQKNDQQEVILQNQDTQSQQGHRMLETNIRLQETVHTLQEQIKTLVEKQKILEQLEQEKQAGSQTYRQWLFESEYFQKQSTQFIKKAIHAYNSKEFTTGITIQEAEYYNIKIPSKTKNEMALVSSNDIFANAIKNTNINEIKEVKKERNFLLTSNQASEQKMELIENLIVSRQSFTNQLLTNGFNELKRQNFNLSWQLMNQQKDLTSKFDEQRNLLEVKINDLQFQLKEVIDELNQVKADKIDKENARKARLNRKRKPKRQNMTLTIYNLLINKNNSNYFKTRRLRIAFCLLLITGIRISELLPLKVNQLKTLIQKKWIAIDRLKRGPYNLKAFLSKEGSRILNESLFSFEALFYSKTDDDFIFTSESKTNEPLRRETLTKEVNTALTSISQEIENKPQISSHSFRAGYITELWKNTQDIELKGSTSYRACKRLKDQPHHILKIYQMRKVARCASKHKNTQTVNTS